MTPFLDFRTSLPLVTMLIAFIALSGCTDQASAPAVPAASTDAAAVPAEPDDAPAAVASPWPEHSVEGDPDLERFVDELLATMSLERKIGQIIQAEIQSVTPAEVREFGLGSVLNGGGSFPGRNPEAPVADWSALTAEYHAAALQAFQGEPAIPLLWGTDAVHGHNNVFGAVIFPHNIALGAADSEELVRAIGRATAEQVSATGIDWNFAPTLAVARDLRWGRAYESFTSDPERVTALGRAYVLGLQGEPGDAWLEPPRVLATAKHFVGDGGTHEGIDQGDTRLDEESLYRIHGLPYPAAIDAGVQTVMASFSSWNGMKMHEHRYLLTGVLKGRLGFDGLVVGDWNGHGQVPGCTVADCLAALDAGVDLFMVPEDWRAFRANMIEHARAGRLSMERLDDAVRRILRVKKRAGLFDRAVEGADRLPAATLHAELARRAVRESLVLLKNENSVLPIDPGARVLVVGEGADDIGMQSGGWTLDWQGVSGANDRFPNGSSILEAMTAVVDSAGGAIHHGEDGAAAFAPDVVVAVIGEAPYAEGQGDLDTLEFQAGTREALELLDRLQMLEAPIVTVFLSGRPMWVHPELNRSSAFVAAWLPGTEGAGVADLVLADADGLARHEFTGRLPFAWPDAPTPGDDGEFPVLFERGYGLSLADDGALAALPEDGMAPELTDLIPDGDWLLFDGSESPPWRLVFQGNNNSADPTVELTDQNLQGDARRVTWAEGSPGVVSIDARPGVVLEGFLDDNAVVAYDLRIDGPRPADLQVAARCGENCAIDWLDLAPLLDGLATGEWRTIRVDLACVAGGAGSSAPVESLGLMSTGTAARISLANVRLVRGALDEADLRCRP